MRALLICLCAFTLACSHDSPLFGGPAFDESPFVGQVDGRIATNTQLDTVARGAAVTLRWTENPLASYAWTLTRPAGSTAALLGATSPTPSFTPDVVGAYMVALRGTRASGAAVEETRRITAATLIGDAACADCHEERANRTALNAHAPAGVSCEDCHGPGSEHQGDPRRITISLRAESCGTCHDGSQADDLLTPWLGSPHGAAPPAAAVGDPSCRRCHTAQGFLDSLTGTTKSAGLDPQGPTCAVCHDPHAGTTPSMSRAFGVTPLTTGGAVDSGRAGACVRCHQSDLADPETALATSWRFPCAVQADMLNGRGAVGFGKSYSSSFHGGTVFRLRPFTGDPNDPDYPDACVTCHVSPSGGGLGGHDMRLRDGAMELVAGNCDQCHPGLTVFNRPMDVDFDGDGLEEGAQAEVKKLSEVVYRAIKNADSLGGLTRPGGALTPIVVSNDLGRTSPLLRRAAYNYNFVILDGSFGIHNTTYAVQLLQRTYEQVTGISFRTAFPDADIR